MPSALGPSPLSSCGVSAHQRGAGDDHGAGRRRWTLSRRQFVVGSVAGAAGALSADLVWPELAGAGGTGPGAPRSLTVGGLEVPLGLAPDEVQFAWQVNDPRRGSLQQAYQLSVSRLPADGRGPARPVWDSGPVSSPEQAFVPYGGPTLAADAVYRWRVRTVDARGVTSPWSAPSRFETALAPSQWSASWITGPVDPSQRPDIYTLYRHQVDLKPAPVARARVYVSGDQQYELYVNGTRAGKGQAYSFPDHQYFETLDVTGLLRAGSANVLAAVTSWQGPTKGHPAGKPGLIVQVSVVHADGRSETIVTDGQWRVRPGPWLPGTQRDLEGDLVDFTENIDGSQVPLGWQLPGFDDSSWAPATVLGPAGVDPWRRLVPVRNRIVEEPVHPVSLTTLSSGALVADFGKVAAASPRVGFHDGQAGRLVTMRAGYLLDDAAIAQEAGGVAGQVSVQHGTQHTDMSYSYVQRGGTEEFAAFDYLGWRYFQIDDPGEALSIGDVTAVTRHTALPAVSPAAFSSSEPVVDAIFDLARHSAEFVAQEQFIDTPTREKGPWLWDGFNASVAAMQAFGEQNLTHKSLLEFAQSQGRFWPSGAVNKIYPTGLGALDINEYTEIYPEWVWQYWLRTGDRSLLHDVYPVLVRLAGYVDHSVDRSSGLVNNLPATNIYYSFPVVTRLNVLAVNVFRRVADVATVLGRPASEIRGQRARQNALARAINARLTRSDGIYLDGLNTDGSTVEQASQDTNACALVYGVVAEDRVPVVARYIAGLGMQAPPRTAAEVLEGLGMAGLDTAMVATLTDAGIDGWARILVNGGTFTWEVWEPSDANGDSMSHGWGANVLVAIQRWLLGVRAGTPGWSSFEVEPPPLAMAFARGSVPTARGTIEVSWQRPGSASDPFQLDLVVPPNARARLRLPAASKQGIRESGSPLAAAAGVDVVRMEAGRAILDVGAGSYRFRSTV